MNLQVKDALQVVIKTPGRVHLLDVGCYNDAACPQKLDRLADLPQPAHVPAVGSRLQAPGMSGEMQWQATAVCMCVCVCVLKVLTARWQSEISAGALDFVDTQPVQAASL